jgi:hypothetical protein
MRDQQIKELQTLHNPDINCIAIQSELKYVIGAKNLGLQESGF